VIFQKFGMGKGLPGWHPHAKFYHFGLVNVDLQPKKIAKNANLWYTFAPKGYIPFGDFYKILLGGGAPRPHYSAKFQCCSFKTVAVWHEKSPKMVIFGKNLPIGKNSGGR